MAEIEDFLANLVAGAKADANATSATKRRITLANMIELDDKIIFIFSVEVLTLRLRFLVAPHVV